MFGVTVHVHPVALVAIVDSHERRGEGSKRAVGTLVGVKEKRGVVVIRNAYPVPHNETEDLVHHTTHLALGSSRPRVCIWLPC